MNLTDLQPFGVRLDLNRLSDVQQAAAEREVEMLLRSHGERLGRRKLVCRFGYDYTAETVWLCEIPEELLQLSTSLGLDIDSITLNEFETGDNLAAHVDLGCFDLIAILSLIGSANFTLWPDTTQRVEFNLPVGSLLTITSRALKWKHSSYAHSRRYSVVFRHRKPEIITA